MTRGDVQQEPNHRPSTLENVSDADLRSALESHRRWLGTQGREGEPLALIGARLEGINLRFAMLSEANLQQADLENAQLEGGRLQGANLQNASLRGANLQRAFMPRSNLQGTDLHAANLAEARVDGANLQGANLMMANLQQTDLRSANLQRVFLKEARLTHANLEGANLQGANLQQADGVRANLRRAVMTDANLSQANLDGADLQGANLHGSNLQDTSLAQANLRYTDFTGSSGLLGSRLAGSDVAGARLPASVDLRGGIPIVRALTRRARLCYFFVISGCLLSWLCLNATTDAQLLVNASVAVFPDVRLPIPTLTLYHLLPLFVVATFVVLNLYLQRLWEETARLPAIFPDGRGLDRVIDPWLPNGLIRSYNKRLRLNWPPLSRLQLGLSQVFIWWLAPLTLLGFWLRGLPRHDWLLTVYHVNLTVITFGFALLFHSLARTTLQGRAVRRYRHGAPAILLAGLTLTLLSSITFGALTGFPPHTVIPDRSQSPRLVTSLQWIVPQLLDIVGHSPFAEVTEADLSARLPGPASHDNALPAARGANLKYIDLRYAKAVGAFLVKADLRGANLLGADLRLADLRGARLHGANLTGTNLKGANLSDAAGLTQAQIRSAMLDPHTILPPIQPGFSQPPARRQ